MTSTFLRFFRSLGPLGLVTASAAIVKPAQGAGGETAPIAVVFDASAADLSQPDIRAAIGKELRCSVQAEPSPNIGQLRISRDARGYLVVRYAAPESKLERAVPFPEDKSRIPLLLGLVAQNLVSGEARELMINPAPPSRVAAPPEAYLRRSGVHIRLSLGTGFGSGIYTYKGESGVGNPLRFTAALTGPSTGLDVAAGYMTTAGVAFGLEGSIIVEGPLSQTGNLGWTTIDHAISIGLKGYVDYYPGQRGPLHLQAAIGLTRTDFSWGQLDIGALDNIVSPGVLLGTSGYVGIGYDLRGAGGFGFFGRTHVAYLVDAQSSYTPMDLHVGASMTWF